MCHNMEWPRQTSPAVTFTQDNTHKDDNIPTSQLHKKHQGGHFQKKKRKNIKTYLTEHSCY